MKLHGPAYCEAMNAAMDELSHICQESERLTKRLHQLDEAMEALKPFMALCERAVSAVSEPAPKLIEAAIQRDPFDESIVQMDGAVLPKVVPMNLIEPADPIQRRINSVLGLAVA